MNVRVLTSEPISAQQLRRALGNGDALATFTGDRIVVFTRPDSEQRYREDVEESEIEVRFGLTVEHVALGSPS